MELKSKAILLPSTGTGSILNIHPTFEIEPVPVEGNNIAFDFNSNLNPSALNVGLRFQF